MGSSNTQDALPLRLEVGPDQSVSALALCPVAATCCLVLAHGAGVGMEHPFMQAVAIGLAQRHIATLRFQFPYMEAGSRRPDRPPVAHATVRAAVAQARRLYPELPLFAGGKSFGGRMTSQAQALDPMPGVRALIFFGFPLHPAGKPASERAAHLSDIVLPMLFLQGTRDELAELTRVQQVAEVLGPRARLEVIEHADHSLHVLKSSGRSDHDALTQALDAVADFASQH